MQCPHCQAEIDVKPHTFALGIDPDGTWQVSSARCPTCDRLLVNLLNDTCTYPAWPVMSTRAPLSSDVPAELAAEYRTASQVIFFSQEASAAVSRRLLQRFLSEHAGAGTGGLADQIDRAVRSPGLPPYLKDALTTYTRLAKISMGSAKSLRPEALVAAEPGEADWLLDVLEQLFDLQFVQPARMQRKQAALEERTGRVAGAAELSPAPGAAAQPAEPASEPAPATADAAPAAASEQNQSVSG